MLKVKLTDGTIILGIDAENVKRLKDDKPIFVKGEDLMIDHNIYIVYGHEIKDIEDRLGVPGVQ